MHCGGALLSAKVRPGMPTPTGRTSSPDASQLQERRARAATKTDVRHVKGQLKSEKYTKTVVETACMRILDEAWVAAVAEPSAGATARSLWPTLGIRGTRRRLRRQATWRGTPPLRGEASCGSSAGGLRYKRRLDGRDAVAAAHALSIIIITITIKPYRPAITFVLLREGAGSWAAG